MAYGIGTPQGTLCDQRGVAADQSPNRPRRVRLYAPAPKTEMDPQTARELAAQLVAAAEKAESA